MPDNSRQDEGGSFKKTFVATAVVHVFLLGGLLWATFYQPKQRNDSVVWMSPGSFAGDSATTQAALTGKAESTPSSNEEPEEPSKKASDQEEEPSSPPPTPAPADEESALPIFT